MMTLTATVHPLTHEQYQRGCAKQLLGHEQLDAAMSHARKLGRLMYLVVDVETPEERYFLHIINCPAQT